MMDATGEKAVCRRCVVCEGMRHHWLPSTKRGKPVMVCQHCPAVCAYFDDADVEELAEDLYRAFARACNWPSGGDEWDRLVPALQHGYLVMATVALEQREP